ncbi:MAG TPA: superoxide dismutase [Gaiellaceae bacterium]|jgi:Fe-Mn family superoxide dismutase|nr:superoxide dismutase [Gaiellaceae bacterium]
MAFTVPDLPYDYAALEPTIDEATMHLHHDKHHQAYVDNANAALAGTDFADAAVEEVLRNLDKLPEDKRGPVRNNAGGHANHSLFWTIMSPAGGGEPSGALADAITSTFGSVDELKAKVNDAGVKRFGSGWTWLVKDGSGALSVVSTANQDSPVSDGQTPLLGIDVWEHAYYLKYNNRRPEYLGAWWNVVNWDEVARRFGSNGA